MWSSLFIVDPWFTLPWFVACVVAWFARERIGTRALALGIALGVGYVGWALAAKAMVGRAATRALARLGLAGAPRFSVPAPLTTLRWRVVAMTPEGFVEGERTPFDAGPMSFHAYRSDVAALDAARGIPAVARLLWFDHGFAKAEVRDGTLVLSDLRMGQEPDYSFNFAVARYENGRWIALDPPRQPKFEWKIRRGWGDLWNRIWQEPTADI
jgi:inner membrane protein